MLKILKFLFSLGLVLAISAQAAVRCEQAPGGLCCWDTEVDGIYKPLSCG